MLNYKCLCWSIISLGIDVFLGWTQIPVNITASGKAAPCRPGNGSNDTSLPLLWESQQDTETVGWVSEGWHGPWILIPAVPPPYCGPFSLRPLVFPPAQWECSQLCSELPWLWTLVPLLLVLWALLRMCHQRFSLSPWVTSQMQEVGIRGRLFTLWKVSHPPSYLTQGIIHWLLITTTATIHIFWKLNTCRIPCQALWVFCLMCSTKLP